MSFSFFRAFALTVSLLSPLAAQPAGHAPSHNEEVNIQKDIELLRTDLSAGKVDVLSAAMQFTPEQAATFWPIYQAYDKEMKAQGDARLAAIQEYANNYGKLNNAKADELVSKFLALRTKREDLLRKCYLQVREKMGGLTAARFYQVENQLMLVIDLQVSALLPIAE
jgi:hypothetical protein